MVAKRRYMPTTDVAVHSRIVDPHFGAKQDYAAAGANVACVTETFGDQTFGSAGRFTFDVIPSRTTVASTNPQFRHSKSRSS
jgi:hypothetical protein